MNDLPVLPIVVLGAGALMIWGGLTGESPVQRVKSILTRGGVQSAPATDSTASVTTSTTATYSRSYTTQRDYLG